MTWRIFSFKSISQPLKLPTKRKKYARFDNLIGRHSLSIGKDLSNYAFTALIIKLLTMSWAVSIFDVWLIFVKYLDLLSIYVCCMLSHFGWSCEISLLVFYEICLLFFTRFVCCFLLICNVASKVLGHFLLAVLDLLYY